MCFLLLQAERAFWLKKSNKQNYADALPLYERGLDQLMLAMKVGGVLLRAILSSTPFVSQSERDAQQKQWIADQIRRHLARAECELDQRCCFCLTTCAQNDQKVVGRRRRAPSTDDGRARIGGYQLHMLRRRLTDDDAGGERGVGPSETSPPRRAAIAERVGRDRVDTTTPCRITKRR